MASLIPPPPIDLSLPLNLPASATIITSSYNNHRKQPLPLLSSPFHSRKQSHWMDAMAVGEVIWHGMKTSEVDGTRLVVRNLKSVIYESKLEPMFGIHIPFIFVWIKVGVYDAHIPYEPVDMAGIHILHIKSVIMDMM